MDIESSEWHALKTMINDGSLSNVKQLAIEFHMTLDPLQVWEVLHLIHKEGFRIWHTHPNTFCSNVEYATLGGVNGHAKACQESYFLNTGYMK